ncbi:oxidative stress survival, Svf1-like protein [Polychytrium aggregatum]|uniref:oxidative stress survival, Svf1-like protein n=1 Tax=Polychytrium aggregatum TaxID=110093 RepID=UPI0022FDF0EC|nr:oxidative stress survival, Svf1-like protein [Polychytrium aggregatum]KAI9199298.1 oxidative stress survival, Svf1-like protein [Polychytrium aggregatum]
MNPATIDRIDLPVEELKWRLNVSGANEAFNYYLTMDEGHVACIQIIYSTLGWSPSVQVSGRFYHANGQNYTKTASFAGTAMVLSPDRHSATCEKSTFFFNPDTWTWTISYQSSAPDELSMELEFVATDQGCQINGGQKNFFIDKPANGYVLSQFIPKAKVNATIKVDGQTLTAPHAQGAILRYIHNKPTLPGRWNWVNFQTNQDSLLLLQFEMPDGYEYDIDVSSEGILVLNDKTVAVTLENCATHIDPEPDSTNGYLVPSRLHYEWIGKTKDGQELKVLLETPAAHMRGRIDVLSELPYFLRVFLQTFVMAPYIYHWVEKAKVSVKIGDEVRILEGSAFLETTFTYKMDE